MSLPSYAELRSLSNFTFLVGASWPEELVDRARELGYSAIAVVDECTLAGVVRAHTAAKAAGLKLLIGSQFKVQADLPFDLVVLAQNLNGYGNLCQFITHLRRSAAKGTYELHRAAIEGDALVDCLVMVAPARAATDEQLEELGRWTLRHFTGRAWVGVDLNRRIGDELWLVRMRQLSAITALPLVAMGNVHMHVRSRKPLQDVLTATKEGKPLSECGYALERSAERHLRSRLRLGQTYPEDLLAETLRIADRCYFSLDELRYQYPDEVVPAGHTPASYLRQATYEGAGRRWPHGIRAKHQAQIEHELQMIAELEIDVYFLTVYDIVSFARSQNILCQGRGSAANSVVCYCLGITEVDPERSDLLFERFVSKERRSDPPDIDVDFEHERREEVIQYLYRRYGRDRAALAAVVISYRPRSALRDVGKALGFNQETLDGLASGQQWWDGSEVRDERFLELGLSLEDLAVRQLIELSTQLMGFPRHLSQHPGGFVLTQGLLSRMVPVQNASMEGRTVIEWDKDDLAAAGLLKVDILALGMLTAIRKALDLVATRRGEREFLMQDIPAEDPEVYRMVCNADTVGVFQIESRAQMSMLPRLRPKCFFDLVVAVALVRPGPIQGGMVHPYLRRRQGLEKVSYPSPEIEAVLGCTLGVALFQEQCLSLAIAVAGFTPGEADEMRRGMAAWKRGGDIEKYRRRILDGMKVRGYDDVFALSVFEQMRGFSSYGFPRAHAQSFALLVYVSCWLKRREPAAFLVALLNSQPLGFYSPSQLIQDARRHRVQVRSIDVMYSAVESTLEDLPDVPAVRLGLHLVAGLNAASAARIVLAREQPFESAEDLARRAALDQHEMKLLAAADALGSLSGHRRQQVWDASGLHAMPALLQDAPVDEDYLELQAAPEGEEVVWDYASTGFTLRRHPLALLRQRMAAKRLLSSRDLKHIPDGREVRVAGIVTLRQQPSSANGTVFLSLEDEFGAIQVIVWSALRDEQRSVLLESRLLAVKGVWQKRGAVCNLIAHRLVNLTPWLGELGALSSRDFK